MNNSGALVITLAQRGVRGISEPLPLLESPDAPVDWAQVVDLAIQHRVAPLVHEALKYVPRGLVPEHVRAACEAQMLWSRGAQLLSEDTLSSLLEHLRAASIEALVVKGPALTHTLYAAPELRPYHDLDIVCRPDDHSRVFDVLLAAGYQCEDGHTVPAVEGRSPPVRTFTDGAALMDIEVHADVLQFGLAERHAVDFWREAQTCSCGACEFVVLTPAHQLLHLAAHAHRHCYSRLLWLIDLDLLIRQQADALDWKRIMRLARDEGIGSVLRHALAVTHAVLDTPIPDLGPPSLEERLLGVLYRALWPLSRVCKLERVEHRRLLFFHPESRDPREVFFGLLLLGRRQEKWQILVRHWMRQLPVALQTQAQASDVSS